MRGLACAIGLGCAAAGVAACAPAPAAVLAAPGVPPRMIAVERAPSGGLRYRLHLSVEASPARPHRLIVWMHPTGASLDARVEPLAPDFARHRLALMVFPYKQHRSWLGREANQLMHGSLPDAAQIPGVDARRPILMGFSAGAMMALHLWTGAPERFGGLVLDGAAPVMQQGGRAVGWPLPPPERARGTPLLVLAGALDPSAARWGESAPRWESAGVPITLRVVPGEGHAPLFDGIARRDLDAWLSEIQSTRGALRGGP